jgi:hypothetical protein
MMASSFSFRRWSQMQPKEQASTAFIIGCGFGLLIGILIAI